MALQVHQANVAQIAVNTAFVELDNAIRCIARDAMEGDNVESEMSYLAYRTGTTLNSIRYQVDEMINLLAN